LAKYVGYEYDDTIPANDNRIIIEAYPFLTRNKGSKFGIELAIKTALVLSDTYTGARGSKASYVFRIDNVNRSINIQIMCVKYSKKLLDLVNYVRPIGFSVHTHIATHTEISGSSAFAYTKLEYAENLHNTFGENHSPLIIGDVYFTTENSNESFLIYEIGINVDNNRTITSIDEIMTKLIVDVGTGSNKIERGDDVIITKSGNEYETKYADGGTIYPYIIPVVVLPNTQTTPYIVKLKLPYNENTNTIKSAFGGILKYTLSDGTKYASPIQRTVYPDNN